MGPTQRKPDSPLIRRIQDDPSSFEFFRAVQLLEAHLLARSGRAGRGIGFDQSSAEVGLRFSVVPTLAFPPTPIAAVKETRAVAGVGERTAPEAYDVAVSFMGLVGPAGTLPVHYTETLLQRVHAKDNALRAFLDGLHDRTTALFYRAWKKYRLAVSFEQSVPARGEADPILGVFLGLVGRRPRRRGKAFRPEEFGEVHHAGLFSDRRRSARGLQTMLAGLLGCAVRVEQFVGQWIELDAGALGRLGGTDGPGVPARLGDETVLGSRVWSVDSRVRIVAGPLDRARFRELWPGGARVGYVREIVRTYLGPLIEFDLEWELDADAPTPLCLGGAQLLGRDCWLGWSDDGQPVRRVHSPPWHEASPSHDASRELIASP